MIRALCPTLAALALVGCQQVAEDRPDAFDAIAEDDTIHFLGTEPFWGGEIAQGQAVYNTPENIEGTQFPVDRFAGLNGLGFSGVMGGTAFDLTITPAECSDGMSDRVYPYAATLVIGGQQRDGCAYTDTQPFNGSENP